LRLGPGGTGTRFPGSIGKRMERFFLSFGVGKWEKEDRKMAENMVVH
jgi:hypothetical protein